MNLQSIQRRLVTIDPLLSPTRSVLALLAAVEFVGAQLTQKKVAVSDELREKIAGAAKINAATIIERPSYTFDYIRDTLAAVKAELPQNEDFEFVRVPETVDPGRFVSSVIALANALLSITRGLDLLPAA